jgi:hypothetical protein
MDGICDGPSDKSKVFSEERSLRATMAVGSMEGRWDGPSEGKKVGAGAGLFEGPGVGELEVGSIDGGNDGKRDGFSDGIVLSPMVGLTVGESVGGTVVEFVFVAAGSSNVLSLISTKSEVVTIGTRFESGADDGADDGLLGMGRRTNGLRSVIQKLFRFSPLSGVAVNFF